MSVLFVSQGPHLEERVIAVRENKTACKVHSMNREYNETLIQ